MLKRFILIAVFIISSGFIVLASSFWLIPKDRLNAIIASQLSDAFGYEVTLSGRPSVHIFPYLSVSFGPLKIAGNNNAEKPLMKIERANGRLSVTSLWEGKPALRYIELEDADIFLIRHKAGTTNWSAARFFTKETEGENLALRFPARLRLVRLKNTNLTLFNADLEKEQIFKNINVEIVGPPRNTKFSAQGTFVWRGDKIEADLSLSEPASFITGKNSAAVFNVSGQWIKARFNGEMNWRGPFRASGNIEAELPNPTAFASWLDLEGHDLLMQDKVSLIGDGIFSKGKIDFRPIGIRFRESRGDGRLVASVADKNVNLSGTLAFDQLKIDGNKEGERLSFFIEKILKASDFKSTLDLRLSSDKGQIGNQNFDNLALGVVAGSHSFLVNIGAASLVDEQGVIEGHLNGEISIKKRGDKKHARANLTLRQTQFDVVDNLLNLNLPLDGATEMTFEASADARGKNLFAETVGLTLKADFQNSVFHGVRFDEIIKNPNALDPSIFNNASFQTALEAGSFEASVNALGIIDVTSLNLKNEAFNLSASGRVDLTEDKVSMLGKLFAPTKEEGALFLTLGGALSSPIISSIDNKTQSRP